MDPLKIVGVVAAVGVITIAGQASFGRLGAAIGLVISAGLVLGVVGLLRTPKNEDRAFGPVREHDDH
jgi:hypothetical protein